MLKATTETLSIIRLRKSFTIRHTDQRTTLNQSITDNQYTIRTILRGLYYETPVYCEPTQSYERSETSGYSPRQPSPAKPSTVSTVGAYDNRFSPQTINVPPGTTVRWVNYGHHDHTVTANDGSWDSGDIKPGASYSATFKQPGTYYYYCRHHTQDKMQGVVVVGSSDGRGNGGANSSGY